MKINKFVKMGLLKHTWILALLLVTTPVSAQLFVGTALNPVGTQHDAFEVNVITGAAVPLFSRAVWGATFDIASGRVLFTSDGALGGEELYQWIPGNAAPTLVGTITDAAGGLFRIDGLAISNGILYGSRAAGSLDGIYRINMSTLVATLVMPLTDSISGLDANPINQKLYGVNDTQGALVEIDLVGNALIPVVAYPVAEDDIDGLAIGPDGRAYLIPDDNAPGEFYVYNLGSDEYEAPLQGPWTASDTFSGGAYIGDASSVPIPVLDRFGLLLLSLLLVASTGYYFRKQFSLKA